MNKYILLLFTTFYTSIQFSQTNNFDKYQYIVVSSKFDFLKSQDQYQTSSLTKFLLKKKGFKVYLSNEKLPKEIVSNRCLALFASVKDLSSLFTTKSVIEIRDCNENVVYTSKEGKSKLKEYKKTYIESIRNAYETMQDFIYSYNPNLLVTKNELDSKKDEDKIVTVTKTPKVVVPVEIKNNANNKKLKKTKTINVLYAQPIDNGFQLVNTKPEILFYVLKTNAQNVFIIKDKNGTLYKVGEKWVAEYYKDGQLIKEEYLIKF